MCEWGDTVTLNLVIKLDDFNYIEEPRSIDRCIAPIVQALNDAGVYTDACCCGHGKQPGSIILTDGRELRICSYDMARKFDKLFPPINP